MRKREGDRQRRREKDKEDRERKGESETEREREREREKDRYRESEETRGAYCISIVGSVERIYLKSDDFSRERNPRSIIRHFRI